MGRKRVLYVHLPEADGILSGGLFPAHKQVSRRCWLRMLLAAVLCAVLVVLTWSLAGHPREERSANVLRLHRNGRISDAKEKAIRYYQACMNESVIEDLGKAPLQHLIHKLGGWSFAGGGNRTVQEMLEVVMGLYKATPFFSVYVGSDPKHSNNNVVQVDQSGLGLPSRNYYLNKTSNDKVLSAYLTYMVNVAVLLGAPKREALHTMSAVIAFESQLAAIMVPESARRDDSLLYHHLDLPALQTLCPAVDWRRLLQNVLHPVPLQRDESLVVFAVPYLKNISRLIVSTDKGVLHTYILWQLVMKLTPMMDRRFRAAHEAFLETLLGAKKVSCTPRWQFCIDDTDAVLGFALGAMFVNATFKPSSKCLAEDIIVAIRKSFIENLASLSWLDEATKDKARKKAISLYDMIGYPNFILNKTKLNEVYDELEVSSDRYFENALNFLNFSSRTMARQLRKPKDSKMWNMTPTTVNAYYSSTSNNIVFPAGILQPPFFSSGFPQSLNFGGIGMIMGHELTHAFDDKGRQYNAEGNLEPWWSNSSVQAFWKRTACVQRQYGTFAVNGEQLDGRQTLGENIADNNGLNSAFRAYEEWLKKNGEEQTLPGLDFTNRQLFFLSFAQIWCAVRTPESEHEGLLADVHSPPRFRVHGSISNSPYFARHFGCPSGSPMNPTEKCMVW
uniref:Endothelin-converting enzyme 1 n=1 Tax=Eptatretus burgeri TaxID=7764 RepID=A0A8C4QTG2_EPTBU